jgi:hypothetical protein
MPRLLLKRKSAPGSVPLTTDLVHGEMALNTADLKLFVLSADGTEVVQLAGTGTNIPLGGITGEVLVKNSDTDGDVSWSNSTGIAINGGTF